MGYKNGRNAYCNCEKQIFSGVGKYDTPMIHAVNRNIGSAEWVGFNYLPSIKNLYNTVVHFYLDDYQFDRVWNYPDKYISTFQNCRAVVAPDFSLYADFPIAVQIYNHYRTHWLAAYWQRYGITVIPTINWSDQNSYEWCLDGVPRGSIISVSTVGGLKGKKAREAWLDGYRYAINKLKPTKIYIYGTYIPELEIGTPIIMIKNSAVERLKSIVIKGGDE